MPGRGTVRAKARRREAKAESVGIKTREQPADPLAPTPLLGPTHQHYTQGLASSPLEDLWALGRHPLYLFLGCGLGVGTMPSGGDHGSPPTATPPACHLPEKILFPPLLPPVPVMKWGRAP